MLSPRSLIVLAQAILLVGAASLVPAAWKLFARALEQGLPVWWVAVIAPAGAAAGWAKARFVMRKRMRRNVRRLRAATGRLWPWQIYPPQLFGFIVLMVLAMQVLKRVLAGSPTGLGILGGVDVAVAVALVVASGVYREPVGPAPEVRA